MTASDAITVDTRVTRNPDLVSAEVGNEVVMLHLAKNAYYDADAIGADIWRRLATPIRVADLRDRLMERYHVDAATCESDVLAFLNHARREGLIQICDETNS